ncbi:hypothetical protein WJX79_007230 [Trebouxia sp. C0005]
MSEAQTVVVRDFAEHQSHWSRFRIAYGRARTLPPICWRSGKVKLSTLLSQCPSLFNDKKISAVDKGLTDIDVLPRHFHHVKTLYLSKNCLRSLQGMQQFSAVVTLAVADNLIDSFDQLEFLTMAAQAHTLRALSLEGNPIARLPNYRAHILAHLPWLHMLDGRAVGPDEPQQAMQSLRHQEVLMALMLTSACLVHKLERKAICQALSREVGRMHRKTACRSDGNTARQRDSWDEAFAQVMLAQQESIAQLMRLYETVRSQTEEELQQVLGHGYGQPDHQLEALHQEHGLGQAHMKKDREGLIQELRGSMYSLLDAFKGDYTQQAMHYEQRMLHLQNTFQAQLATSSPVQAAPDKQPGWQDDLQTCCAPGLVRSLKECISSLPEQRLPHQEPCCQTNKRPATLRSGSIR